MESFTGVMNQLSPYGMRFRIWSRCLADTLDSTIEDKLNRSYHNVPVRIG